MTDSAPAPLDDSRALDMIYAVLASRQASNLLMSRELSVVISLVNQTGRKLT